MIDETQTTPEAASEAATPPGAAAGAPAAATSAATSEGSAASTNSAASEASTVSATEASSGPSRVREAIELVKHHPLGAVATVAAAAALIEVEFAVGVLAGLGATALLATKSGSEARQAVFAQGKRALDRARTAIRKDKAASAAAAEASPPA